MIENLRQIMNKAAERYGREDPWVLELSQRLDELINRYYKEATAHD
jgi:hypothetical protein